jgi:hypothetical protein
MTILSNSWVQHLKNLARNNDANKNMKAFMDALAPSMTISKRLNSLVEEVDNAVPLVGPKNSIQQTHSCAKFGGMQSQPDFSIICLIRKSPQANAVTVDHNQAVAVATIAIPLVTEISNCKTIYDFKNLGINVSAPSMTAAAATTATLPTAPSIAAATEPANATAVPSNASTGCRTTRRSTVGSTEAPTPSTAPNILPATPTSQTIKVTSAFVMAPFLCDAIFNKKSSDPLKLIVFAQEAAIKFDSCHQGEAGFTNASATDHAIAFTNWALATRLGKLTEASFTINPDNNELQAFLDFRHAKSILLPLGAMGNQGATGQPGHLEHKVFKSLGKGLKQMGEVADKANLLK